MIHETYPIKLGKIFSRSMVSKAVTLVMACGAGLLLAVNLASADTLPGDLSISNSEISFDTGTFSTVGASTSITGSSFSARVGGADTTTDFDQTGLLAPATNPIPGNFTDTGDGFGIRANALTSNSNPDFPTSYFLGVDMGFDIQNNSLSDTYDVVIQWMFDNSVTASGPDAYSDSVFDLWVDSSSAFTDITADTFFGNEIDGNLLNPPVYGGTVTDADTLLFTLTLAPSDMFSITGEYTLAGEAFEGTTSASFSSFLSIDSVTKQGVPAVPEPTTMLLFGVGLAGLAAVQRHKKRS